ncbi:MAG: hypothetical protein E7Z92_04250 [Cyanobacteria bacterium SIG31]|nr:hypothetical protein [Cyanobacteria bacterium SIG31]
MIKKLKELFYIKKEYCRDSYGIVVKKHIIICICGTKLKIKQNFSEEYKSLYEMFKNINIINNINNDNFIYNLILQYQEPTLFYLKNNSQVYIFTKEFLKQDKDFIYNYLLNTRDSLKYKQIKFLDENHPLYNEHITLSKQGEFCWKYVRKHNGIFKTSLYKENDNIYFKYDFLGLENAIFNDTFTWGNPKPRKYVKGTNLFNIIVSLDEAGQYEIIKKFFDWLFEEFKTDDENYLSQNLADCHFKNFIVADDGKFYFTDYEYASKVPLEKGYLVYYTLSCFKSKFHNENNKMYKYFISLYGLKDKIKTYKNMKLKRLEEFKIKEKDKIKKELANKDLISKYF